MEAKKAISCLMNIEDIEAFQLPTAGSRTLSPVPTPSTPLVQLRPTAIAPARIVRREVIAPAWAVGDPMQIMLNPIARSARSSSGLVLCIQWVSIYSVYSCITV